VPPPRGDSDNEHLTVLAPQLIVRLSALIRTARTYDIANQAFQRQLQELNAILARGMEQEQELAIETLADYLYLNGVRIRAHASQLSVYHGLIAEFERRSISGLCFREGITAPELERFFQLFMAAEDPVLAERLGEALQEASIQSVELIVAPRIEAADVAHTLDDKRPERGRAKRVFWSAVHGTRKIVLRAAQTGRPDLCHAKRLVQPLVDNVMRHEYSIVGLTALKDHDEYTYAHCVNVSVLSINIGHVLGFSRQALADLGVAALIHDIGKMSVPGEVLRKPAALSADEWHLMRRHPLEGMKMILRMPGISTIAIDSMRVCLEHHMNYDRTGYPDAGEGWRQAAMSRIVALAHCFDAMTAHRSYHRQPYSPFQALQYLLGPNRVHFDPAVLWGLVKTVGLYPPGSVLLTSSGHIVLAINPNPIDLRRPTCKVLLHPDGTVEPDENTEVWEPMPEDQHVVRVLKPEEYTVNPGEYLAAA
jgi:HD-GYP domain-containing protein (c-di-GMP phosphodiesterase class II)